MILYVLIRSNSLCCCLTLSYLDGTFWVVGHRLLPPPQPKNKKPPSFYMNVLFSSSSDELSSSLSSSLYLFFAFFFYFSTFYFMSAFPSYIGSMPRSLGLRLGSNRAASLRYCYNYSSYSCPLTRSSWSLSASSWESESF
jgi:hypothetical protein